MPLTPNVISSRSSDRSSFVRLGPLPMMNARWPLCSPRNLRNCLPTFAVMSGLLSDVWEQYLGHAPRSITARHYIPRLASASHGEAEALERQANLFQLHVVQPLEKAMDSNGVNDIKEVYYIVYKPDGSTSGAKLLLFDDGNIEDHGDLVAGDGIYSRLIQINETNDKGTYRFEFQAEDRSGDLSNIINHFVLIQ